MSSPTAVTRHPLVELTLMRLREFTREREAVFWAVLFPVLLAASLGIAFRNQGGEVISVAVTSPRLAAALAHEPQLDVQSLSAPAASAALAAGKVALVAESRGDDAVAYRYDDTNPDARTARLFVDRGVQRAAGRADPVAAVDQIAREPGSRYIDFLVPGLVGMGVMGNSIWGLGFSIVDTRRRKLLKRLMATPMSRPYYLLSFLIWRLALLGIEVGIPIAFGVLAFGVPVRGSLLSLVVISLAGSLAFSALGLLLASRVRTIEAISGLANVSMVPMWILSGVFFASRRFPAFAQPIIRVLPLTAMNDALRASMLQGASLADLGGELAVLGVWLVVCFPLAVKLFRWR
jgi:ABC-type multidrug transport system permease subunit